MVTSVDSSLLLGYYQSRAGLGGSALIGASSTPSKKVAPTAPWSQPTAAAATSEAVKAALAGRKFVNETGAQLDLPGASQDYRKLFALYQGLSTLSSLAEQASGKNVSDVDLAKYQRAFGRGLQEISTYVGEADFDKLRVIQGDAASSAKTVGITRSKPSYTTPPLVTGSSANVPDAFLGNVQFKISVKRGTTPTDINIDLAEMGGQTRSLANVVAFMNTKLKAAGVDARFATERTPGGDKTTKIGGRDVKIGTNPDQFSLKLNVATGETVSFSAAATQPAVYVAQDAGDPNPDGKTDTDDSTEAAQFLKFQTGTSGAVPAPLQRPGESNWVDGRLFGKTLGPEVKTVRDTKVAADGSVYLLADVTDKTAGQEIKGAQDVALLKYDAAGNLIYARTLGAADEASGLSMALSADGKIAVAGSVKGVLTGATDGALNSTDSTKTDSFVTVYDAEGQELWTQRRGARLNDEATDVAFGADGAVYVTGRTTSARPNGGFVGGSDTYLEAFKADAKGVVKPAFTTTFGTTGDDKPAGMVVDGTSVITASVENGRAILRRYDVSGASPVLTSTRDIGDLQGGSIAGLAIDNGKLIVAGSTRNASLSAGSVTKAHAGGMDAFAASLNADLSAGGQIAYYGGSGDDVATSLAVSNGQVWIGGSAGKDIPGYATSVSDKSKDGFLAQIDVGAGSVPWSRRFTGKDGRAAPTSIAVDATGASVLDRIGLPKGELDLTDSQLITAQTSIRAGDTFKVKSGFGVTSTVTIEAKDTLDSLATKIKRASGYTAKISFTTVSGVRTLRIEPNSNTAMIEFSAGKTDKDALALLGIPEGVVRKTVMEDGKSVPADRKGPLYGLSLPSNLKLDTESDRKRALAEITSGLSAIRSAYKDLVAAASPRTVEQAAAAAVSGPVPTYLQNQLANYQAALARLGGG
jgi:hypothetical protein